MYNNKKKTIIIVMCIAIFVMITGYSLLSTNLNIKGTSNLTDTWGIKISNVTYNATGRAYNIEEPTYTDTNMTFNVGVKEPGDKMVFDVTVTNYGTLDAILEKIDATTSGSYLIIYSITGIEEQSKLKGGESITFQVTTEFDINATSLINSVKTLNINLAYVQDDGQTLTPSNPNITDNTLLVTELLASNNAQSDGNIDFSQISSDTNGKGLYYTSINTEGNKKTYYFRGEVDNNYVSFAGFIWRIVRINEDGSIRLIKNENIGKVIWGDPGQNSNVYVGYMYGANDSTTYAGTHANTNSSDIKQKIDKWYEDNLTSYASYLVDAGFCGDRSVAPSANTWVSTDTALGYGTNETYYGAYYRLALNKTPQFKCSQTNDLYTTTSSTKGNKALTYPIGLITADEVAYAGGVEKIVNTSYYINKLSASGNGLTTMTPGHVSSGFLHMFYVNYTDGNGTLNSGGIQWMTPPLFPVINLKSDIAISGGIGTSDSPYIIKTN